MKKPKFSVIIITLNEEKDLPRCLESVKNLADEIVVVDSGSTDKTVEIAKKYKAKVFERNFDNYSNQKNYAAKKASGDWILSMDADEEVTPELAKEIRAVIEDDEFVAFNMPRKNMILGKFIKYSRWQPEFDRHIWLWKKGKGKWIGKVHEEFEVSGAVGRLENPKIHRQYKNVSEFMNMMNRYSELDSGQRVENGLRFSYVRLFFDPVYNFLVRYFYRLGILDGWRGFVLSYLMGVYHFEIWVKIWESKN